MGIFDFFKKKETAPSRTVPVIIPDHAKLKKAESQERVKKLDPVGRFEVTELLHVGDTMMVKGKVGSGRVKAKMKAKIGDKDIGIEEVMVNNKRQDALFTGEEGTLFLSEQKFRLHPGDVLEFR